MNDVGIGKYGASFALSLSITSLLNAFLVVIKEQNQETVLAWMKAATGHHWVSHGILVIGLFVLLGWGLARLRVGAGLSGNALSAVISVSLVLSGLIIAGYFA